MLDYSKIPSHMRKSAQEYLEQGILYSDFLEAVMSNQLVQAFLQADDVNTRFMKEWASFLYNECPMNSYGSKDTVTDWIELGGLAGMEKAQEEEREALAGEEE